MTDGQKASDRFTRVESPNACDQIAFCAFHSFLVKVQTNAGYIHATLVEILGWARPGKAENTFNDIEIVEEDI